MTMIRKDILKNAYSKLKSFINIFVFSFSVSWNASKGLLIARSGIIIFNTLTPFVGIYIGKEIINLFIVCLTNSIGIEECTRKLITFIGILLIIQLLEGVLQQIQEYCGNLHMGIISRHINLQIAKKAASLDISYFDSSKFYDELTNARRDSAALQTFTWLAIDFIRGIVQFAVSVAILSRLNVLFTVILVVTAIPSIIVGRRFAARLYHFQRSRAPEERKMEYILGILTGRIFAKDVRLYSFHDHMISRYDSLWQKWFSEKRSLSKKKCKCISLLSVIPEMSVAGMMLFIGYKIFLGQLTIGDYTLYSGIINQMTGSIGLIINLFTQMYENDIKLEKYKVFLQWENRLAQNGDLEPLMPLRIEFVDVSFKYPGTGEYVLNKLNFKINEGEKIAFAGLNGSGKSTIIKLILRLYDPDKGAIMFNGRDAREYDVNKLRKCFSVLFQDYANYSFTIRENISLADIEHIDNDPKIFNACLNSEAYDIVQRFEKGLDTYLTRQFEMDGKELSGGEWQKIALARAFFREGGIIILDEPSASLDPESEYRIFKKYADLCKDRGTIFISHRLSNVTMADRIIVLDKGSVLETGTHEELLKKSGKYAYLFNLQAEKYRAG